MITLENIPGTLLYQSKEQNAFGFVGFYLATTTAPPKNLSVHDVWTNSSYYGYLLFLSNKPSDLTALAAAIAAYRKEHGNLMPDPKRTSFAWITYAPATKLSMYVLQLTNDKENIVVADDLRIPLGNYGLPFLKGDRIEAIFDATSTTDHVLIEYPAIPNAPVPIKAHQRVLPLSGKARGCILSEVSIGNFSDDKQYGWNAGFRYFYESKGNVLQQFYPLFQLEKGCQVLFDMQWDPLAPMDETRTFLAFTRKMFQLVPSAGIYPFEIIIPSEPHILSSCFRTVYGHRLRLEPVKDSASPARLVFEKMSSGEGMSDALYLVPAGDFILHAAAENKTEKNLSLASTIICGLAGTEYISVTPGIGGDVICFYPHKPAFAPTFSSPAGLQSSGECVQGELLCDKYKTSWAGFKPRAEAKSSFTYFAQPEKSPLFEANNISNDSIVNILTPYPTPAASFNKSSAVVFPFVPYAAVKHGDEKKSFGKDEIRKFEMDIIAPWRRTMINRNAVAPVSNAPGITHVTTTPQGLLATVTDMKWERVLLARNEKSRLELQFVDGTNGIPVSLREALQTNELFLVITLSEPLKNTFKNTIDIDGWRFVIETGSSAGENYSNVLLLKFCKGSIAELAADTNKWAGATTFNTDPKKVSSWLHSYIQDARTRADKDSRYKDFFDKVSSPSWNGILALNTEIDLNNFPEDLQGLLGGIDLSRFNAHHFGIETNFVKPVGTGLEMPKSSLFGLISYYDAAYARSEGIIVPQSASTLLQQQEPVIDPGKDGFDFTVLTLQVVFKNSVIHDFASKIRLSAMYWFGEPAFSSCTIDLLGSYERHDDEPVYSFTTLKDQSYQFYLNSQVVNYIDVVKAKFNTNHKPAPPGKNGETITKVSSTFSFWGYLNFAQLEGFDMFSFGDPVPDAASSATGLYFYNLAVNMDFLLTMKEAARKKQYSVSKREFKFVAENIAFDISQSNLHLHSLYGGFPLTVTGITRGTATNTIEDMGYIPVRLSGVNFATLGPDWYALNCTLNLGSMGALASLAGFTASVLIAWSPSTESPAAVIAIKLPGTGTGKSFSFESVLQLSIDKFDFLTEKNELTGEVRYSLRLRNIGLSALGVKLPPGGNTHLTLFGNPEEPGEVGWYGAYYK